MRVTGGILMLALLAGLGACGGSSGTDAVAVAQNPGLLKLAADEQELTRSLQDGLSGAAYVSQVAEPEPVLFALDAAEGGLEAPTSADGGAFSQTNVQEAGVDESDIVKYDGAVLYVLKPSTGPGFVDPDDPLAGIAFAPPRPGSISVLRTDPEAATAAEIANIELDGDSGTVAGLYLHGDATTRQLVAVGSSNDFSSWGLFASDYYWQQGQTHVQSWQVSQPEQPEARWSLALDGTLLASRRVGDRLYLLTRFSPQLDGLLAYPQTEADVAANREVIDAAPLTELLPQLVRDEGIEQPLLAATDCYIPNQDYDGAILPAGGSLITVTEIDLAVAGEPRSICLNAWSSGFYASTNAIYVTANGADNTTLIHKIALTQAGPVYRGSGSVEGYLGTGNPAFLMSEYNGDLRVVSSRWDDQFFPLPVLDVEPEEPQVVAAEQDFGRHRLTILRESDDGSRLEVISRLPNETRPAPIGKPGEDVYAARFLGERGFVVTFEVIDPLYVLNLADPEDPMIAGELEIPGFSTLLQPLGENLLLGVGREVPEAELNLTQGIKVALFDVADITSPLSLGEVVIGKRGSHSPALYDHKTLTLLQTDTGYRVAVPIERHTTRYYPTDENDPWAWYDWTDSSLYLFEVDTGGNSLESVGRIVSASREDEGEASGRSLYRARSVLHEGAVFFSVDGDILAQPWP